MEWRILPSHMPKTSPIITGICARRQLHCLAKKPSGITGKIDPTPFVRARGTLTGYHLDMIRRILKSATAVIITLWAIATGTFLLMETAPGGPESSQKRLDPIVSAHNLAALGLVDLVHSPCDGVAGIGAEIACGDRIERPPESPFSVLVEKGQQVVKGQIVATTRPPLMVRYLKTMGRIAVFDLGITYSSGGERTVRENLADGLPVSAAVGGLALLFAIALGIPAGLIAASRRETVTDSVFQVLSTAAISLPAVVGAPLWLYLFSIKLGIFAPGGLERPVDLVLPALTLGISLSAVFQRMTRAGSVGFLNSPEAFNLTARGISTGRIVGIHALRHAAIAMLGWLPPAIAGLLTGSLVVETVFHLPGMARHLIGAALTRDYPMVMGVVLVYSLILVVATSLADAIHPVIDPRLGTHQNAPTQSGPQEVSL